MAAPQTYTGNGLTVTIADPENITKDECLQLARAGSDVWNGWRKEFPVRLVGETHLNTADFSNTVFSEKALEFNNFHFGDFANFREATFSESTFFVDAVFGTSANFYKARFGAWTKFDGANFGNQASFNGADFGDFAGFEKAVFLGTSSFWRAQFYGNAHFRQSRFRDFASFDLAQFGQVDFSSSQFESTVRFKGTILGNRANFCFVKFDGDVDFQGMSWPEVTFNSGSFISKMVPWIEQRKRWADQRYLAPDAFLELIFDGAVFGGVANFSNRKFLRKVTFSPARKHRDLLYPQPSWPWHGHSKQAIDLINAARDSEYIATRFDEAPIFHDCELRQDTNIADAHFPKAQGDDEAARAYRTLKLAFAQQQAIREEQRFFKLEMQEEAARESGWKRWLYRGYDYFSDFGFSIWRPLARLVLWPGLGFLLGYLLLMALNHTPLQTGPLIDEPALLSQWLQFTFANMAPLPDSGLLRELRNNLFGNAEHSSIVGVFALALETAQKLLALIGYFLMGLALRNLFKMK